MLFLVSLLVVTVELHAPRDESPTIGSTSVSLFFILSNFFFLELIGSLLNQRSGSGPSAYSRIQAVVYIIHRVPVAFINSLAIHTPLRLS